MTHSDLERELEKKGRELMRVLLQEHLKARGPGQCEQPVRGADGVERARLRLQERKLETVFGTVSVERFTPRPARSWKTGFRIGLLKYCVEGPAM